MVHSYSRDPNKNTCAQTFFWKKVPPVRPFMGPVRLEKFGSKKNYKVFCEIETKLESTSQKNKHMLT